MMRIAPYATPLLLATMLVACAKQSDSPKPESTDQRLNPIVNGVLDTSTSHDGVILLFNRAGGMCTGAVISQPGEKGVVLTARHCVSKTAHEYVTCKDDIAGDYSPDRILVLAGTNPSRGSVIGRGEKFFHSGGSSLCNADFAVMVMQDTLTGVQPLKVRIDSSAYFVGEEFTAIGYGLTDPNSYQSGQRYLREGVMVRDLGPRYYGLYANEFIGTTSICSGDSGGPAVSEQFAVIGITSRGGDCYGDNNIWTRPDGFKDLIDEAMQYAGSSYMDEDGVLHGGSGGLPGGADRSGEGAGGTNGDDPGTGGSNGQQSPPPPSCGDLGPCPPDATCVVDPVTAENACGITCDDTIPCPGDAVCDADLGVCVIDTSTEHAPALASTYESSVEGGCSVSTSPNRSAGEVAAALLLMLGISAVRRRRHGDTSNPLIR